MIQKRISKDRVATARPFEESDSCKGIVLGTNVGKNPIKNFAAYQLVDGKPTLLLNDDMLEKLGIAVRHADSDWNVR